MAHLWLKDINEQWSIMPMEHSTYSVGVNSDGTVFTRPDISAGCLLLISTSAQFGKQQWILMSPPSRRVWINGQVLATGIHILQDKDHIQIFGEDVVSFFYSSELLPQVTEFPGSDHTIHCPRCKRPVVQGEVVKCPSCNAFYHASQESPCWIYSDICAMCPQETDLDAAYSFNPEDL